MKASGIARSLRPSVFTFLTAVCVLVSACGPGYMGPPTDTPEGQFEYARHLLENGKYYDAMKELEAFMAENPGSGLLDTAIFYMGEAYMGRRDYPMASAEYERLLREFPGSGHAPTARYRLGVAYYEQSPSAELDPTMTERAIEQLRIFVKLHPGSQFVPDAQEKIDELRGKLAKKGYLNGKLYIKLGEAEAARFYFDIVLERYPDTAWASKASLGIGRSYELEKNAEAAVEQYIKVLRSYPGSEEAEEAKRRLTELEADVAGVGDLSTEKEGASRE